MSAWNISDAKIQLSKIVKLIKTDGPQIIKYRGAPNYVIISYEDYLKVKKSFSNETSSQDIL